MGPTSAIIHPAVTEGDMKDVKSLFRSYHHALGVDISYQGFEQELANLPGPYAGTKGAMLLAKDANGFAVGCVCLKPMSIPGRCEMKRLYVIDSAEGQGLGRKLAQAIIAEAQALGYRSIMLDSLRTMTRAIGLYVSLGFTETAAYYETPLDTRFFEKELA